MLYDYTSQPFSVGDLLIFQEASLVLRAQHGLGAIDFAVVYDPKRPVVPDPVFSHIDPESFLFHLCSILPAAQVNPHLGSLFLFDSHRRLEAYVADNAESYFVWPSLGEYASGEYLFYHCMNELFPRHIARCGDLPPLRSRPAAQAWAGQFIAECVGTAVPVTVQLRRSPTNPARNSVMDAWLGLFRQCADRYDARFVVICARSEVDLRLRDLPNVVIAKDHGTMLEQDLALIEAGAFHMGASSGPATMVLFSRKPYCVFNSNVDEIAVRGLIQEDGRYRLGFSTSMQSWVTEPETEGRLVAEFQRLWAGRR